MTETPILVEIKDQIGIVTLNRPEQMNTFTVPFARQLNQALWDLDADDGVRVVVIRGAGKHFSVGIALDEFKGKTHAEYRRLIEQEWATNEDGKTDADGKYDPAVVLDFDYTVVMPKRR